MIRAQRLALVGACFALLAGYSSSIGAPANALAAANAPLDVTATVTGVTPDHGSSDGGDSIALVGTGFTGATDVDFGTDDIPPCPAANGCFTFVDDTDITAVTPPGASGTVDVTVTTGAGPGNTNAPDDQFTFVDPPTVTSVTPASGPTSGGNSIVVVGTNLTGATDVFIDTDDVSACPGSPCFTVNSATQITVADLDPHAAATVDVTVQTPGGTSATSGADHYTFVAAPTVTGVNPTSGPTLGGNTVGVTGTGFAGATDVLVGPTDVSTLCPGSPCFTVNSPTSITVNNFPAHASGTVDIRVETPGGTSATSASDQYTFVVLPTVTSVSPSAGPTAGGNTVTVTGTQFSGTTDVFVGAADVTNTCGASPCYTVNSPTSMTVSLPAHAAGTVDITVETAGGTSAVSSNDRYTFDAPPTVTNVTPPSGPASGGNSLTVTGTAFTGATDVFVGGVDVTNVCPGSPCYTVNSATSITVNNVSAHAAGTVDITVQTPGGTSNTSGSDQYVFVAAPTVTDVSPSSGPSSGGNQIVLTGTLFTGATDVFIGAVDIGNTCPGSPCFTVASAGSITVNNLPAHAAGTVDVTVVTAGGTSATSSADRYTFVGAPTVTNVVPDAGPVAGGNTVNLTGSGFTGASDVLVGATDISAACPASPCFTVNTDTQITVQNFPAHAAANGVDITVQAPGGTSSTSSNDQYSFVAIPTVTNVSPPTGPLGGGNTVTVTGTAFESAGNFSASSVSIGSSVSTQCPGSPGNPCFTLNSPTSLTVSNVPAHAAGTVDVTVTTPGGTSATSGNDAYTFAALPTVTSVSPPAGPAGVVTSSVTLTGSAFEVPGTFAASDVFFGALDITASPCPGSPSAPCFTVVSATQITVEAVPAHAAGTVDITVQTPAGTSAAAPPGDTFAWAPVPTVTNVSPNAGATSGGTAVVVTGTGFESGTNFSTTAVMIGSTPCAVTTCYVVNSATQITIVSMPAGAAGTVEITVTTIGGVSALNPPHDAYTYVGSFPTVTSIAPSSGAESGGAILTVTGTNFGSQGSGFAATKVTFGSTNVTTSPCPTNPSSACFNVINDSTIRVFTPPGAPGAVDVQVTNPASTNPSNPVPGDRYTYVAPSVYTPLAAPFRICDTRSTGTHVGCSAGRTLGPSGTVLVDITTVVVGGESVPAGATAVVVNLTALNHSAITTFVSAYPAGGTRPLASNVNVDPVTTQANLAIVALSSSGFIDVFNSVGSADVLVDVEGYFAAPSGNTGTFHALSPVRICDTRPRPGASNCTLGPLTGGTWRKVVVSGLPPGGTGVGIPANSTAKAAVFNLTAVTPTAATFLAVTAPTVSDACPTTRAGSSNLNPKAGETEPNRVISNLGPTQDICVFNSVGSANFIIDVSGWFGSGAETPLGADFYAVAPTRICDTRPGSGTLLCTATPTAASVRLITVAGIKVTPALGGAAAPVAIVANLTGISGTASTFLELYPADALTRPGASDLNPAAHDVIANLDIVSLATTGVNAGKVDLFNSVGTINVIIDIAGWFQ